MTREGAPKVYVGDAAMFLTKRFSLRQSLEPSDPAVHIATMGCYNIGGLRDNNQLTVGAKKKVQRCD